jgi:hypothetical protein
MGETSCKTDDEREQDDDSEDNEKTASSAASTIPALAPTRCDFPCSRASLGGCLGDTSLFIKVSGLREGAFGKERILVINSRLRSLEEWIAARERLAQSIPERVA